MNSSLEPPRTVVFALCGSFCTFETVLPQIIRLRACGITITDPNMTPD